MRRRTRRRRLVEAAVGLAMIPLTAVPIWLYVRHTDDGYLMYLRGRYALAAPGTPELGDEQLRLAIEARRRLREIHGIPVLVYHGIGKIGADDASGRFVLSRERFAEQLGALRAAGYEPVTTAQLALYLSADPASEDLPEAELLGLPEKPVLITFDDGRADAMIQADPILEDTRMLATMFVIGKPTESGSFYYESADRLRAYAESGRWELQNHTFELHDVVETPAGRLSALVATASGESVAAYARRVAGDLDRAQALVERLSGREPVGFAYPFGDWGESAAPGVEEALRAVLAERVEVAFDQDGQDVWRPALPGDDRLRLHRLEVADWSGAELLAVLEDGAVRAAAVYEERGLGYRYSELELALARARTACVEADDAPVRRRDDLGGERLVALSFNGGPSSVTADVLDVLARYDAAATFFVRGSQIEGRERLLRRMLVEGNELANGTLDGTDLAAAGDEEVEEQIDATSAAVREATGDDPCLVRPPFGSDAERVAAIAAERGVTTALWSVDPRDYEAGSSADIAGRVLTGTEPGDIVVLHDGGGDRLELTVEALPAIIEGLHARGFRLVTISELLAWQPEERGCADCAPAGRRDEGPLLASYVVSTGQLDISGGGGHAGSSGGSAPHGQGGGSHPVRPTGGGSGSGGSGSGGGSGSSPPSGNPTSPGSASPPPSTPPAAGPAEGPPVPRPQPGQGGGEPSPPAPPASGGGGGGGGSGGGSSGGGSSGGGSGGGGGSGAGGDPGSAAPPGHGGTPPGQGGTPPGQSGGSPGQGGGQGGGSGGQDASPPGHGGTPPGHGGTPPGQGKN